MWLADFDFQTSGWIFSVSLYPNESTESVTSRFPPKMGNSSTPNSMIQTWTEKVTKSIFEKNHLAQIWANKFQICPNFGQIIFQKAGFPRVATKLKNEFQPKIMKTVTVFQTFCNKNWQKNIWFSSLSSLSSPAHLKKVSTKQENINPLSVSQYKNDRDTWMRFNGGPNSNETRGLIIIYSVSSHYQLSIFMKRYHINKGRSMG